MQRSAAPPGEAAIRAHLDSSPHARSRVAGDCSAFCAGLVSAFWRTKPITSKSTNWVSKFSNAGRTLILRRIASCASKRIVCDTSCAVLRRSRSTRRFAYRVSEGKLHANLPFRSQGSGAAQRSRAVSRRNMRFDRTARTGRNPWRSQLLPLENDSHSRTTA